MTVLLQGSKTERRRRFWPFPHLSSTDHWYLSCKGFLTGHQTDVVRFA